MLQQFWTLQRKRDRAARGGVGMKDMRHQVLNQPMRRAQRCAIAACFSCLALQPVAWPSGAGAAETAQVRIGIARTMSDVGYYVADTMGFFRTDGIEVTMLPFNSAA